MSILLQSLSGEDQRSLDIEFGTTVSELKGLIHKAYSIKLLEVKVEYAGEPLMDDDPIDTYDDPYISVIYKDPAGSGKVLTKEIIWTPSWAKESKEEQQDENQDNGSHGEVQESEGKVSSDENEVIKQVEEISHEENSNKASTLQNSPQTEEKSAFNPFLQIMKEIQLQANTQGQPKGEFTLLEKMLEKTMEHEPPGLATPQFKPLLDSSSPVNIFCLPTTSSKETSASLNNPFLLFDKPQNSQYNESEHAVTSAQGAQSNIKCGNPFTKHLFPNQSGGEKASNQNPFLFVAESMNNGNSINSPINIFGSSTTMNIPSTQNTCSSNLFDGLIKKEDHLFTIPISNPQKDQKDSSSNIHSSSIFHAPEKLQEKPLSPSITTSKGKSIPKNKVASTPKYLSDSYNLPMKHVTETDCSNGFIQVFGDLSINRIVQLFMNPSSFESIRQGIYYKCVTPQFKYRICLDLIKILLPEELVSSHSLSINDLTPYFYEIEENFFSSLTNLLVKNSITTSQILKNVQLFVGQMLTEVKSLTGIETEQLVSMIMEGMFQDLRKVFGQKVESCLALVWEKIRVSLIQAAEKYEKSEPKSS